MYASGVPIAARTARAMPRVQRDQRKPLGHRDGFVMTVCLVLAGVLHYLSPSVGEFEVLFAIWAYVMGFIAVAICLGAAIGWLRRHRPKT